MPGTQRGDTGVQILDPVTVTHRGLSMSGQALGGRRARVALVALALAEGPVPADRLAAVIWADDLPATWPAALRLRAIARGSYELLHDDEARVFRLLGVLDGPVALPLVRDMVAGGPIAPVRVVRILRELTARGLLAVDRSGPRWRYHQDDDLHRYARELLASHGEERAALDRLAGAIGAMVPAEARTAPGPYLDAVDEVLPSVRPPQRGTRPRRSRPAGRCRSRSPSPCAWRPPRWSALVGGHGGERQRRRCGR